MGSNKGCSAFITYLLLSCTYFSYGPVCFTKYPFINTLITSARANQLLVLKIDAPYSQNVHTPRLIICYLKHFPLITTNP